jgi:hypothetical protein
VITLWRWLVSLLVWLSADPVEIDLEHPRAAAAVAAARASMAHDTAPAPPAPAPKPPAPGKCQDCKGTGWITHGDGHRTKCPCGAAGACPDGKCPAPAQKNVLR